MLFNTVMYGIGFSTYYFLSSLTLYFAWNSCFPDLFDITSISWRDAFFMQLTARVMISGNLLPDGLSDFVNKLEKTREERNKERLLNGTN